MIVLFRSTPQLANAPHTGIPVLGIYIDIDIDNATNLKDTWITINGLISNTYIPLCNSFNLDNNIITDTKSIANEFNTYFSNIGKKLDSSIEKTETNNVIKYLNIPNNSSFFLSPITSNDLINDFNNFKPKKSLYIFNFNMDFLKIISPYILHPLLYLFNKSFSSGIMTTPYYLLTIVQLFHYQEI